jgi:hypothetical protein
MLFEGRVAASEADMLYLRCIEQVLYILSCFATDLEPEASDSYMRYTKVVPSQDEHRYRLSDIHERHTLYSEVSIPMMWSKCSMTS